MASRPTPVQLVIGGLLAALVIVLVLPNSAKTWAPGFLRQFDFHFGLDLAGGTQLDFRISEEEIAQQLAAIDARIAEAKASGGTAEQIAQLTLERQAIEQQQTNIVEAIRTVLERRINSLGVSEATITPSYLGGEKHLLVECPGIVDVQECIATVGKTIQLEFKEEFDGVDENYERDVRAKVNAAMARARQSGATLQVLGQDLGTQLGVVYLEDQPYFRDELPKGLEALWDAKSADGIRQLEGAVIAPEQQADGQVVEKEVKGVFLTQILQPRTSTGRVVRQASTAFEILQKQEPGLRFVPHTQDELDTLPAPIATTLRGMQPGELRTASLTDGTARVLFLRLLTPGQEQAEVSHILVQYKGSAEAGPEITRTKEEALARATEIKKQLTGGSAFDALARTQSDGPSKTNAGKLGAVTRGSTVPSFEVFAFSAATGAISDPIETPFGYHLIRVDKATHKTTDRVSFDGLTVEANGGIDALARANTIVSRLQSGDVKSTEDMVRVRSLFFSLLPTGWKDTSLDGKHFRAANVTLDPTTNRPVVQIVFDEEGGRLFQELTRRNVNKQIAIFVGGELVSAPVVQAEIAGGTAVITGSNSIDEAQALAQDLNTGAIPAPIYLSGQRTVEATLGAEALRTSLYAALVGVAVLMLYMLVVYRFLGVLANLALIIYALIFVALLKLPLFLFTTQYIVLTLAGIAGLILSIGLAIDANVLVFERVKEELKKGKSLKSAVEVGFDRAWPSIRDSNITTIITCVLLFIIGTSIVRGFAVTLGIGVVVSMLTGVVIIRWIARWVATMKLADRTELFPGMNKMER